MKKTKKLFFQMLIAFLLIIFTCVIFTPNLKEIQTMTLGSDRILLAANGEILQVLRTDYSKRRLPWYRLDQFSTELQNTVIKTEDQRFRLHFGVDPIGLTRAFINFIKGNKLQGASTITMQLTDLIQADVLIRNQPIKKGSLWHKAKQIIRAFALELKWSKKEILEAYLNLIPLRGEIQGIPAASFGYFNKHPLALDRYESLLFAASISSPNLKAELLLARACRLLDIAESKLANADCEKLKILGQKIFTSSPKLVMGPNLASHFAQRLFQQNSSKTIISSFINYHLQEKVTEILEKNVNRLKNSNVSDAAAIVIENKTGNILAYVGAVSSSNSPHVDGVKAYRQAGSALKPFLYTKALDTKTLTASSILLDEPTVLSWSGQTYRPLNYDKQFSGQVSVREALASSLNVPAVKIVTIIGLHQTYQVLQDIGLTNLKEPDFYGVSMALGAVEVRLEDLANAYRILAHGGEWSPLHWTLDSAAPETSRPVFSKQASFIVSSILSDPNARSTGFGWESPLDTPFWAAVKTGTSKDYRDNWCVGFSDKYTVGVWAGNFDASPMEEVSGVTGAGPSWYEIMNELHHSDSSSVPIPPEGIITKEIHLPWASHSQKEFYITGTEPTQKNIEVAQNKRVQFVFPAEGSVLVKDPHLDSKRVALAIRFTGEPPVDSFLYLDGKSIGKAVSPFIIEDPSTGKHRLEMRDQNHRLVGQVNFIVKCLL
jgi:penicillin-binding protein 1C